MPLHSSRLLISDCLINHGIQDGQSCYIYVSVSKSFCQAMDYCHSMGGWLANFPSTPIPSIKLYLTNTVGTVVELWAGLRANHAPAQQSDFYWMQQWNATNGLPVDPSNWAARLAWPTPQNMLCGSLYNSTWNWGYGACPSKRPFLCQIDNFPNRCKSYGCQNGGTCVDLVKGPICICPDNVGGLQCELSGYSSGNETFQASRQNSLKVFCLAEQQECGSIGGGHTRVVGDPTLTGCYKVNNNALTWGDAMAFCNERGGFLARNPGSILSRQAVTDDLWTGIKSGQSMYTPTLTGSGTSDNSGTCSTVAPDGSEKDGIDCYKQLPFVCIYPSGIRDCMPQPCMNGGTCIEGMNSYSCQCPPGFSGAQCEAKMSAVDPSVGKCRLPLSDLYAGTTSFQRPPCPNSAHPPAASRSTIYATPL